MLHGLSTFSSMPTWHSIFCAPLKRHHRNATTRPPSAKQLPQVTLQKWARYHRRAGMGVRARVKDTSTNATSKANLQHPKVRADLRLGLRAPLRTLSVGLRHAGCVAPPSIAALCLSQPSSTRRPSFLCSGRLAGVKRVSSRACLAFL